MNNVLERLEELNINYSENVSLKKHSTYNVGGKARVICYPNCESKLIKLIQCIKDNKVKYKVIGNGSNLLFSDELFDGVIINLKEFDKCKIVKNKMKVGAGYSLVKASMMAARHGLTGLEFAAGIPGTIGGAVYMNAGAYKSDMGYVVEKVKVLTDKLEIISLVNKEMNFHYRTSFLQKHKDYICLEALIKLKKGNKDDILDLMESRKNRRIESQPLEYPSCGSVFRNPTDDFAGRLIEEAGLKGKRIGGAMVSEKHANFIINYDKASAKDIHDLIIEVHDKVLKKYNIDLKIEQEFVNWE